MSALESGMARSYWTETGSVEGILKTLILVDVFQQKIFNTRTTKKLSANSKLLF